MKQPKWISEFKAFATRGNVVDMAVGIILGAAFGKIVSSLVGDLLMPVLGFLIGEVNFSDLSVQLLAATDAHPAVVIAYGKFIQTILDFTIIAFAIFGLVKGVTVLQRKHAEAPAPPAKPSAEEKLLAEIRDLLKQQNQSK